MDTRTRREQRPSVALAPKASKDNIGSELRDDTQISPQEFYREMINRPEIRAILEQLAKA